MYNSEAELEQITLSSGCRSAPYYIKNQVNLVIIKWQTT